VIGAVGNNGIGITGIIQRVALVPLRVYTDWTDVIGGLTQNRVISAINFAGSTGIRVLNMSISYGGPQNDPHIVAMRQAILVYNGVIVVAAGNNTANLDNFNEFPQNFNLHNMITVGASDLNDHRYVVPPVCCCAGVEIGSNFSSTRVHLFAPGVNIRTTTLNNGYSYANATSFAAPFVAGTVALMLSRRPNASIAQLRSTIFNNVDRIPALNGLCSTGGRLNVHRAVQAI
jgi:subtilisin family serine protease